MIHELLAAGSHNARTGKEIAKLIGCDLRRVTIQIERERREGWPICANTLGVNAGYYLAESSFELDRYITRLGRRARELMKTKRALQKTLKKQQPCI